MADKTVKCAYKYCLHGGSGLKSVMVSWGNRYIHQDCNVQREAIGKIRQLYLDKVSDTVVMSQLNSVLNTIIHKRRTSAEYVYFALNSAIRDNRPPKYPAGLYYVVDNYRYKQAFNRKKMLEAQKKYGEKQEDDRPPVLEAEYSYTGGRKRPALD